MEIMSAHEILDSGDFKSLSGRRNMVTLILTIVEMVLFFGFIALISFDKPFLSVKLPGAITVGIPVAVGAILLSWMLTGIYVWWANNKYDVLVKKVRDKVGY